MKIRFHMNEPTTRTRLDTQLRKQIRSTYYYDYCTTNLCMYWIIYYLVYPEK